MSDCEPKNFGNVVKTEFYLFTGRKTIKSSFLNFDQNIFGRFVKTAFYVSQSNVFVRNFFQNIYMLFRTVSEKFPDSGQKKFRQVFQNCFSTCPDEQFVHSEVAKVEEKNQPTERVIFLS